MPLNLQHMTPIDLDMISKHIRRDMQDMGIVFEYSYATPDADKTTHIKQI